MRFLVTRAGSLWSVLETTTGGLGGLFVSLDAALGFVRSAAGNKAEALRVTVR